MRLRTSHRGTLLPVSAHADSSGRGSPFHFVRPQPLFGSCEYDVEPPSGLSESGTVAATFAGPASAGSIVCGPALVRRSRGMETYRADRKVERYFSQPSAALAKCCTGVLSVHFSTCGVG